MQHTARAALRQWRLLFAVTLATATVLPASSAAQDKKGDLLAEIERQMGLVTDHPSLPYVRSIGARLAEQADLDTDLRFFIVDMDAPNAFALEGGEIFVSRGLLTVLNSEDELANVMAHEIGHVARRHHQKDRVRRVPLAPIAIATGIGSAAVGIVSPTLSSAVSFVGNAPGALALASYSRGQENEADEVGQAIAAKAGWNPGAMSQVMDTLAREEELMGGDPERRDFFATHPTSPERSALTAERAKTLTPAASRPIAANRTAFLQNLVGLLVGEGGAAGVIDGSRFLHPDLGFSWTVPEGWEVTNGARAVRALAPQKDAALTLQIAAEGADPAAGASALESQTSLSLDGEPRPVEVGSLPALRGRARAGSFMNRTAFDLFWIAHAGHVYQIAGVAAAAQLEAREGTFLASAQSFGPLAAADRAKIREGRLRLVEAREGESFASLVERHDSAWSAPEAAAANALPENASLSAGQNLKLALLETYRGK